MSEQALVLGDGSFVKDEGKREGAAEVQSHEVDVSGVFFQKGFFREVETE